MIIKIVMTTNISLKPFEIKKNGQNKLTNDSVLDM